MEQPAIYLVTSGYTVCCFKREVVGAAGFEPVTSATQRQRSTKLSYAPNLNQLKSRAVLRRWQFAHRTSHFSISASILWIE